MADNPTLLGALKLTGIFGNVFLAGFGFATSHLMVPLMYKIDTGLSTTMFSSIYFDGAKVVAPTGLTAAIALAVAAYLIPSKRVELGIASALTVTPLVFTQLVMKSNIDALLELGQNTVQREKVGQAGVEQMLRKWFWHNLFRSAIYSSTGLLVLGTVLFQV